MATVSINISICDATASQHTKAISSVKHSAWPPWMCKSIRKPRFQNRGKWIQPTRCFYLRHTVC